MKDTSKTTPLTEDHFRAFGFIVHLFARHEAIMVGVLSKLIDADVVHTAMITAELPYRGKRETLLAMIKEKPLPPEQIEKISGYLGQLHQWNPLRNSIAHSQWKRGKRPGSVMPFGVSIRGGEADYIGFNDERDYTIDELISIANQLVGLRTRFSDYLRSIGLLPRSEDIAE